jgi:hypothetical protein
VGVVDVLDDADGVGVGVSDGDAAAVGPGLTSPRPVMAVGLE